MSHQRALEGPIIDNATNGEASEILRLREVNRTLTRELHDALDENERLRTSAASAGAPIARLRQQLEPLYRALQGIWGDVEAAAPASEAPVSQGAPANSRASAAWEEWKQRLGGASAKIITALQTHADADVTQLCILIGTNRKQTVYDAIHKLNKSGLINKNGDRVSLKSVG